MSSLPMSLRRLALRKAPISKLAFISRPPSACLGQVTSSRFLSTISRPPLQRIECANRSSPLESLRRSHTHRSRWSSSLAVSGTDPAPAKQDLLPAYQITFTCKPCGHRSSHRMTKQAYHHGTVLIKCPSCENRHVIADHLKVFMDQATTLEDILKKQTLDGKPLTSLIKRASWGCGQIQSLETKEKKTLNFGKMERRPSMKRLSRNRGLEKTMMPTAVTSE